jgi:hypothetical protein
MIWWWWPILNIRYPWSGDWAQEVSPVTSSDLPFNNKYKAGSRKLERDIIEEDAGYGRQLGILLDAVEQLVAEQPDAEQMERPFKQLLELANGIRATKKAHYEGTLRGALESYRDVDPAGFAALIAEVSGRSNRV